MKITLAILTILFLATIAYADCQLVVIQDREYISITRVELFDVAKEYDVRQQKFNFHVSTNGEIRGTNITEKWIGHNLGNWKRRNTELPTDIPIYVSNGNGGWKLSPHQWMKFSAIGTELMIDFGKISCDPNETKIRTAWAVYVLQEAQ